MKLKQLILAAALLSGAFPHVIVAKQSLDKADQRYIKTLNQREGFSKLPQHLMFVEDMVQEMKEQLGIEEKVDVLYEVHGDGCYDNFGCTIMAKLPSSKIYGVVALAPSFAKLSPEAQRFVVGHELGHIKCQHPLQHADRQDELEQQYSYVRKQKGDQAFDKQVEQEYLAWQRDNEYEADRISVEELGCYDGAVEFMNILIVDGDTQDDMNGTHPAALRRLERIKSRQD